MVAKPRSPGTLSLMAKESVKSIRRAHERLRYTDEDTSFTTLVSNHEDLVYGSTAIILIASVFAVPMLGWIGTEGFTDFRFQALSFLALIPLPMALTGLVSAVMGRRARRHLVVGAAKDQHAKVLDAARRASALEPTPEVLELLALAATVSSAFCTIAPELYVSASAARNDEDAELLEDIGRHGLELSGAADDLHAAALELEAAQAQREKLKRVRPDLSAYANHLTDLRMHTRTSLDHARDTNQVTEEALLEVQRPHARGKGSLA